MVCVATSGTALASSTALATGTYYVSQTVGGVESARTAVSVTVNPAPNAGITNNTGTTILTCNTPSISLTATGGGTYLWSNGSTNQNISVSTAGTYSVIVTDANGCTATTSVTITQPAALVASSIKGAISCNGGTTTVTVSALDEATKAAG